MKKRKRVKCTVFDDKDLEIKMREQVRLERERIKRVALERVRRKEIARQARLNRKRLVEATTSADPIMIRLMNDIDLARRTEQALWKRLARYLARGEDCEPQTRIRIQNSRKERHRTVCEGSAHPHS